MSFDLSSITKALEPVRDEYRRDVSAVALEIFNDDRRKNGEDVGDLIHEHIDGNWWVIYTYAAQAVLMVSDNGDAWEDAGFGSPEGDPVPWSAMAYYAIAQDVRETLGAMIDPD